MSEDSTNYDVGLLPSRFPIKEHNAQFEKRRPAVDKRPLAAAIGDLERNIASHRLFWWTEDELENHKQAISVLRDWPRWKPLIEAAGKADAAMCLSAIKGWRPAPDDEVAWRAIEQIRAILEALPAQGKEEPK